METLKELGWKGRGLLEEREWAHNRVKVCVCVYMRVCVCVAPIDSQSMPKRPTLMGFLWLKKVKGEYNDIKTWWLHPGSDHSAPQQLPDRARLDKKKKERLRKQGREKKRGKSSMLTETCEIMAGCYGFGRNTLERPVLRPGTKGENGNFS